MIKQDFEQLQQLFRAELAEHAEFEGMRDTLVYYLGVSRGEANDMVEELVTIWEESK